jgi:hypothetical protein
MPPQAGPSILTRMNSDASQADTPRETASTHSQGIFMHSFTPSLSDTRQFFWLEADSDVLCRVLGLYAARGLRIARLDYEPHSTGVGRLVVTADGAEDVLRILVAKAASLVGVVCAHADAAGPGVLCA